MKKAHVGIGQVVSLTYKILDQAGELLEYRDLPISYVHGAKSMLFPEIVRALEGKSPEDTVTVELSADQAFGPHDPDLASTHNIDSVPEDLRQIGVEFKTQAKTENGKRQQFRVTKIENDQLTVDANHPLAGKDLAYEVTITAIREATEQELASGEPAPDQSRPDQAPV